MNLIADVMLTISAPKLYFLLSSSRYLIPCESLFSTTSRWYRIGRSAVI